MKLPRLFLLLSGVLFLIPFALFAQEKDPNRFFFGDTVMVFAERNLGIPTINAIATKMIIPLHATPASVGVVTRAIFEGQNGIILSDALKNISGVNVQNGFGTHDFFLIRGFDSLSSGLVLTDGAAEPEVSFYNLYNIERVEVLKGPGAFLYGGNPLSGAVNLVRKQPVFENFANVSGSFGEFQSFRGTFDVGMTNPNSNVALRFNGLWQDSNNYRDDKENNTFAINPALTWRIDRRSSLTANFEFVNSDYQPDSGLPIAFTFNESFQPVPIVGLPDVPRSRSYQTPLDDSDQQLFRVRFDFNRELNKTITLRNKLYFTRLDWQANGTLLNGAFPNFFAPGKFNVFRTFQTLDDQQNLIGNQLEVLFSFKTGSIKHNLITGFESARLGDNFSIQIDTTLAPLDLFEPTETVTDINQLNLELFSKGDARSLVFAPYFVNQITFSKEFQLFLGGRFDVIDYNDNRSDFGFPSVTSRNYKKFSPMVGLVVSPVPSLSFYANAGQSFAPPSSLTFGDPKPEESTQFEIGTKLNALNGKLRSSLAVFHLQKDNISIPDELTGIPQQIGDQRSRGFEFEVAAQPLRNWHTFLNYAFTDAELTEFSERDNLARTIVNRSGNTPAFAPKHILNFWTTKQYKSGIGFGAGFRYVSSQFIDEDNLYKIDDYLTFDASVYYTFDNLRWSLNFKNITDQDFETRGFSPFSVTPANPRAVYGSISFSL
jgi:iron complex outermembrane receptor protein